MKTYDTPSCACRSTSRLRIAACTETSSADVGSSQSTRAGAPANERATDTRCFSPPHSAPAPGPGRAGPRAQVPRLEAHRRREAEHALLARAPAQAGERAQRPRDDRPHGLARV